jgi:HK97 family phage major capsid protein
MASLESINLKVDQLGQAWEQFKSVNDLRLKEVEKKGSADALHTAQLNKINDFMDQTKDALDATAKRVDEISALSNRPMNSEAKAASPEEAAHHQGFLAYIKKGQDVGLAELEKKALSVGSDPDGGYLVTPQMSSQIITQVYETSPLRQVATVETISTDSLDILEDRDEAAEGGWVSETGSRSDSDTPQLGMKNIPVHEIYAQPKVTQKGLDDISIDIESWLARKVADIFMRKENTAFISGATPGKPRGILTYTAGTSWKQVEQIVSGSAGEVTLDSLISIFYALKEGYAPNGTWLMRREMVKEIRLKKSGIGDYLWQPGLVAGQPDSILGRPVLQCADMPAKAVDALAIAFGDWKRAYTIVDRIGIRVLRDPFTEKPFIKFYTTKRVGGDVTNFEAFKILKLAAS